MMINAGFDARRPLALAVDAASAAPWGDAALAANIAYAITDAERTFAAPVGMTVTGPPAASTLTGGPGADLIQGGAGNDRLIVTQGSDTLDGGGGTNTAVFNLDQVWTAGVAFNASGIGPGKTANLTDGSGQTTHFVNIQNLEIHGHTTGPLLGDVITGGSGNDTIYGGPGNNILDTGGGQFNTLYGGTGDNIFYVHSLFDKVVAQPGGYNTVFSSAIITLPANVQALYLQGNVVEATGNNLGDLIVGDSGANTVIGGTGNDTINGMAGNDRIDGGAGNNAIDGGTGVNTAIYHLDTHWAAGQPFDGSAIGPAGAAAVLNGGPGNNDTLVNIQNLEIWGFANAPNHIVGSAGTDIIRGGTGNDHIDAGPGADLMAGGPGDDTYIVDNAADRIIEYANQGYDSIYSSVTYTLPPNVEMLHLTGHAYVATGNELDNLLTATDTGGWLRGQGGNDTLVGGAGNDILDGGPGADTLTGGGGINSFVERKGETDGDTITDFKTGHDKFELVGWGAGTTVMLTDATHNSWTITDGVDHTTSVLNIVGTVQPTDIMFG